MKSHKIYSIIISLMLVLFMNFSSNKTENQYFIRFNKYSDTIKSLDDIEEIKTFGRRFKEKHSSSMNSYIQLRNYTYNFEMSKNPFIGFLRAKKIYDILEKECAISRTRIHYIDIAGRDFLSKKSDTSQVSVGIKLELH